ncbi:MAG TPA: hypothetical protein PKL31_01570 [Fulvivirga sp.]|nr:hypothetical protein [Fulvivirga sp.]
MKQRLIIISCALALFACSSSEIKPDASLLGYDFFPLAKGQYSIYQVSETSYLATGEVVNDNYQLLEEIHDSFLTAEDSTYVIYRFRRNTSDDEWTFINTWQARRTPLQAIVIEGNTPFIKISFPLKAGKVWNGNGLNTNEPDEYKMDSVYFSYINEADQQFDNTVTVIQSDNQDFIVKQDKRFEIYAQNIGLVYARKLILVYCSENDCLGQQLIDTGLDYSQTLIEYGEN